MYCFFFFFQAEDGIRDLVRSRGLGDVYKRQEWENGQIASKREFDIRIGLVRLAYVFISATLHGLSLIHI